MDVYRDLSAIGFRKPQSFQSVRDGFAVDLGGRAGFPIDADVGGLPGSRK